MKNGRCVKPTTSRGNNSYRTENSDPKRVSTALQLNSTWYMLNIHTALSVYTNCPNKFTVLFEDVLLKYKFCVFISSGNLTILFMQI